MDPIHHHSVARRPFKARGANVRRCPECQLALPACICAYRVQVPTQVEFWLLMHPEEAYKPSNTGRLIADCLPNTRVFLWSRTQVDPELLAALASPCYAPMVIFPDDQPDYAQRVSTYTQVQQARPQATPVFILLEGTWRQARRIFRKSPYLAHLPILPLRGDFTSQYQLRKASQKYQLCTVEVAIELLKMAQEPTGAQVLGAYFHIFNTHYAASRQQAEIVKESPAHALLADLREQRCLKQDILPPL